MSDKKDGFYFTGIHGENVGKDEDHSKCGCSTGIHDGITFGQGELNFNGFWERPCGICARKYEKEHPGKEAWPFSKEFLKRIKNHE